MERTTVMMPADLKERAIYKAQKLKISFGELVRKSLEIFIDNERLYLKDDPFIADKEIYCKVVKNDLSKNHDIYIYGE